MQVFEFEKLKQLLTKSFETAYVFALAMTHWGIFKLHFPLIVWFSLVILSWKYLLFLLNLQIIFENQKTGKLPRCVLYFKYSEVIFSGHKLDKYQCNAAQVKWCLVSLLGNFGRSQTFYNFLYQILHWLITLLFNNLLYGSLL